MFQKKKQSYVRSSEPNLCLVPVCYCFNQRLDLLYETYSPNLCLSFLIAKVISRGRVHNCREMWVGFHQEGHLLKEVVDDNTFMKHNDTKG